MNVRNLVKNRILQNGFDNAENHVGADIMHIVTNNIFNNVSANVIDHVRRNIGHVVSSTFISKKNVESQLEAAFEALERI
jgi:hypothetical protein